MTDNDITLAEVYRAVLAVDARLRLSDSAREQTEHSFRNKLEVTNLKAAVLETRVEAVESAVEKASDPAARWGSAGAFVSSLIAAWLAWKSGP